MYSFALRLEGRPQDAEDIVQETFLRAYHALKSYPVLKVRALRLRQWLYTITLNIFRNRQRKPEHQSISLDISEDSPLLEIEDPSFGPDEEAYWHEWRRELEMYLATLSERYRVAITLYYFEDLSYAEIAELSNQPIGTVKAHVHRALRAVRVLHLPSAAGPTNAPGQIQHPAGRGRRVGRLVLVPGPRPMAGRDHSAAGVWHDRRHRV